MKTNFSVKSKRTDQNLYIRISGCFDGSSAWELINTINRKSPKSGKVFIDTDNIRDVVPFGKNVLDVNVKKVVIDPENIFFTGKYYKTLMPEGCRYYRKKGIKTHICNGNCKDCSCRYIQ